ncbi:MAG: SpoIIE family protein phosphatase [Akkermansiaceae bacterium]|nr:SpoIIE family protein phosphatase [Akkermansiaceae bacterium]
MKSNPQDRLELALLASNEGVWDWYVGEEDIYYSDRVLGFLGYSADQAPNIITHAKQYFHEEELPELRATFKKTLAQGGEDTLALDCRYNHPDGTWHWLRIRGICVRGEDGEAQRIVGSIIDISQRKYAEINLEEERYKLRQLIENIPVNVYYKDKESNFVLTNSSLAKRLGAKSAEDMIGKSDRDYFDKAHADLARANELEVMETRVPLINALQEETYEGKETTWAEATKLPWLDRKGQLCGTFGISHDITDLVKVQRQLTATAEELHQRNVAFEEELQLAREIQQALLPQSLDGLVLRSHDREVTFGCRYSPASAMAGDFFEVMPISQHCIGIFLCDVMGHGVRASLVVSMLRGLMEKERDSATSPEWFLYGINEGLVSIFERAGVTLFATAIYCVVNLKEGTLRFSCAGHPSPISVRRGKGKQIQPAHKKPNPALGLISQAPYTAETVSLNSIDRLLIFTDGLHEVEDSSGEQLGIPHVVATMEKCINDDLETCLDSLIDQARRHAAEAKFDDDVCLFAMDVGSGL